MGILSGILGNEFFIYCYTPLGELMDMLVLTNCMVNFILYCIMSRQFRITFKKIFGIQKPVLCLRNTSSGLTKGQVENILTENYFLVSICVAKQMVMSGHIFRSLSMATTTRLSSQKYRKTEFKQICCQILGSVFIENKYEQM